MRTRNALRYINSAGLAVIILVLLAIPTVAGTPAAPPVVSDSLPWAELLFFFIIGSMSSFGWSRFVPESIGHDTERVGATDTQSARISLGKYVPDSILQLSLALSRIEISSALAPKPHLMLLGRGSELLGVRTGWAGVFDPSNAAVCRIANQDGPEPVPVQGAPGIPLNEMPELLDWLEGGEPVAVNAEQRQNSLTRDLFGDTQAGLGLLLPLRSGGELVGFHYWLGIQDAELVKNPRVAALSSAAALLAGRLSSLRAHERLGVSSLDLEINAALREFTGARICAADLPMRLLQVTGELCRLERCTLWLADRRAVQLHVAAVLPEAYGPERPRVLRIGAEGIAGHAAAERAPIWVPDVSRDERYVPFADGVQSEFAIPLIRGERLLGVFVADAMAVDAFSDAQRERIEKVAGRAAMIVENHDLYNQSQLEMRKLAALHRVGQIAIRSENLETLLDASVGIIAESFGYPHVYVFLSHEGKDFMTLRARACTVEPSLPLHFRAPLARGMVGFCGRTSTTLLANDVSKESLYFAKLAGIGSELCVPIVVDEKLLGVLDLMDRRRGAFLMDDVAALEEIVGLLAGAVQLYDMLGAAKRQLTRSALIDRLVTRLCDARDLTEMLDNVFQELRHQIDLQQAYLLLRDKASSGFRVAARSAETAQPAFVLGAILQPSEDSRLRELVESKRAVVVGNVDVRESERHATADARYATLGLKSLFLLPVLIRGELEAILLLNSGKAGSLRESLLHRIEPVVSHVKLVLASMRQGSDRAPFTTDSVDSRDIDAATDQTTGDKAPSVGAGLQETLGDILGRVQTLLMHAAPEGAEDRGVLESLHEMEHAAAHAFEYLQTLSESKAHPTVQDAAAAPRAAQQASNPVPPSPPAVPAADPSAPKPESSALSILVVDDQENILDVVVDILSAAGHTVQTADTISSALEQINAHRFDLVFSDWSLDTGNARPVIKAAAAAGFSVVVTTGWRGEVDEKSVFQLGAKAILRKPFDVKKLLDAVQKYGNRSAGVHGHE